MPPTMNLMRAARIGHEEGSPSVFRRGWRYLRRRESEAGAPAPASPVVG
jgi:hypothetical protein